MKKKIKILVFIIVLFSSMIGMANHDKILFAKEVPLKLKSENTYTFIIGYDVSKDRDISIEFSGTTSNFWIGKVEQISKGQGVIQITLKTENKPVPKSGYRLIASVRESGGDWKTTTASAIINNLQITNENEPALDDANFDPRTETSLSSRDVFDFDINYVASKAQIMTVSIWNENKWVGASEKIEVTKGSGTKKVKVNVLAPMEGKKYRFVLYYGYGSGPNFPDENLTSKEISGIEITKQVKVLTMPELTEKSITLIVNRESPFVTLPGDSKFESIKIIGLDGQIVKEVKDKNSILVSDLAQGPYFIVTSKDDYYKFVKN
jgi:hypothetical protein